MEQKWKKVQNNFAVTPMNKGFLNYFVPFLGTKYALICIYT